MILILRDAWSLRILKYNILVTEVDEETPPQFIMRLSKSIHSLRELHLPDSNSGDANEKKCQVLKMSWRLKN